ncbi:unnamed protein product [Pedinophyceae sp. YPF-701]|nr:unnamed protein product [Pedinophyceae sp. YPF-701]
MLATLQRALAGARSPALASATRWSGARGAHVDLSKKPVDAEDGWNFAARYTGYWSEVPYMAKFLGLAGLIPFAALGDGILQRIPFVPQLAIDRRHELQMGYAMSIASFVGAMHWGFAFSNFGGAAVSARLANVRLWGGILPSVVCLPSFALHPQAAGLPVVTTLLFQLAMDDMLWQRRAVPRWYLSLRAPLVLGACISMLNLVAHAEAKERRRASGEAAQPRMSSIRLLMGAGGGGEGAQAPGGDAARREATTESDGDPGGSKPDMDTMRDALRQSKESSGKRNGWSGS